LGFERVDDVFDFRLNATGWPSYSDNVETCRAGEQTMALKECQGQASEPTLFVGVHRFRWMPNVLCGARFHFNENNHAAVEHHEVKFARAKLSPARQELIAEALQVTRSRSFTPLTQCLWASTKYCAHSLPNAGKSLCP
jgi:hypothetical protein